MKYIYQFFITIISFLLSVIFFGCAVHYQKLPVMPEYSDSGKIYDTSAVTEVLAHGSSTVEKELREALHSHGYVNFSSGNYYKDITADRIRLITLLDVSRTPIRCKDGWYLDTRIIVSVRAPGVVWNQQLTYPRPRYFQTFSRCMTGEKRPSGINFVEGEKSAVENLFLIEEFRNALEPAQTSEKPIDFVVKSSDAMWQHSLDCQTRNDPYEALRWAFLAAERGNGNARKYVASCAINNNIFGDNRMLYAFISKAAQDGDMDAILKLGKLYECGIGTIKNDSSAFYWYKQAADKGNVL